jgi:hypothetical protein
MVVTLDRVASSTLHARAPVPLDSHGVRPYLGPRRPMEESLTFRPWSTATKADGSGSGRGSLRRPQPRSGDPAPLPRRRARPNTFHRAHSNRIIETCRRNRTGATDRDRSRCVLGLVILGEPAALVRSAGAECEFRPILEVGVFSSKCHTGAIGLGTDRGQGRKSLLGGV